MHDRGRRLTLIDLVDGGVSVVNRHARFHEQPCGGGLPHSDRAGQSENPHQIAVSKEMILDTEQPLAAQERQQLQQRQAEYGEVIALDAFEQMHAKPFELIGADAGRNRLPGLIQIGLILATTTSENNILPSRATATAECSSCVWPASRRNCSAACARPAGLLNSRFPNASV